MLNVLIDTSPLGNANAIRGVGVYTRLLTQHLEKHPELHVVRSGSVEAKTFNPDLIHYPYFDLFFSTLPKWRRKPTVVTVHDVIPLKFPRAYPTGIKGKFRFWRQNWALGSTQAIITDSLSSKADIVEHLHIPESKVHPIYLAADPAFAAASEDEIKVVRKKYDLPVNYILYVGDINYNKNLPQLVKALKFLPDDLYLVCVGKNFFSHPIPEWQALETQIALSNVTDRVIMLSNIYSDGVAELAAIYSGAVAYVQPSLYEGFGLPVLEALQCRTPVVSAHTSSLVEVGGDVVVFTETDGQDLAEGVKQVLALSATKRLQVQRAGYKWSQTFSWDKVANDTIKVYESLVKHHE